MADSKIAADSDLFNTLGYKQTCSRPILESALPPGADIPRSLLDFRFCEGLSDACRGQVSAMNSSGRRRTSLRGGNRGGIRLDGAVV